MAFNGQRAVSGSKGLILNCGSYQTLTNHSGIVSVPCSWEISLEKVQCGVTVRLRSDILVAGWFLPWVTHQGVGGQAETGNSHTVIANCCGL